MNARDLFESSMVKDLMMYSIEGVFDRKHCPICGSAGSFYLITAIRYYCQACHCDWTVEDRGA